MILEDIFDSVSTYVICSTLNQVVNYMPILTMKDKFKKEKIKIASITPDYNSETSDKIKRFDNKSWNENLRNVLSKLELEELIVEGNSIELLLKKTDRHGGIGELNQSSKPIKVPKKIVWNVTGGQRNTLFKIQEFISRNKREKDYIIYLEGNRRDIIYGKLKDGYLQYSDIAKGYDDMGKEIELEDLFKLAGFDIGKNNINFKEAKNGKEYIEDKYKEEYEKYKLCEKLYKHLKKSDDKSKVMEDFRKLNCIDNSNECETKKFHENYGVDRNDFYKIGGNSGYRFGYILEYMTIAAINDYIENDDFFTGLYHSVKTKNQNNDKNNEFCEFDVLLVTTSGQIVFFECKSGKMKSENAKARNYTAYAVGGVYGKPILITPLLQEEIKNIDNGKKDEVMEDYLYTYRAATRAKIQVWSIDDNMEKRLKELFIRKTGGDEL